MAKCIDCLEDWLPRHTLTYNVQPEDRKNYDLSDVESQCREARFTVGGTALCLLHAWTRIKAEKEKPKGLGLGSFVGRKFRG